MNAVFAARFAALALTLGATASVASAQTVFLDQGGIVIIEMESGSEPGAWNESTSTPGFVGDSYIRWDGPNLFNQPGAQGIFGFNFEVQTSGNYRMAIRNRHENPDPTEENDVWVRMDGGPWVKTFSNMAGSVGAWTWESRFDFDHGNQPDANYNLSAGQHRVEFSGRSFGFKMDRVHFYLPGNPNANNANAPESPRRVGGSYCTANANSTGVISTITGIGNRNVSENNLTLSCNNLPANQFGIFVVGRTQGFTPNLNGTNGNLCITGDLGRYNQDILNSGPNGTVELLVDVQNIPRSSSFAAAQAGETWRFQFWHRDLTTSGGANLSRGYRITFN